MDSTPFLVVYGPRTNEIPRKCVHEFLERIVQEWDGRQIHDIGMVVFNSIQHNSVGVSGKSISHENFASVHRDVHLILFCGFCDGV